jgi:hypothetical protein
MDSKQILLIIVQFMPSFKGVKDFCKEAFFVSFLTITSKEDMWKEKSAMRPSSRS